MSHFSQRGNALFLILIAVILFAALAYAVSKSNNGNAGQVNEEKLSIEFSTLQQIGTFAVNVVQKMELNGCGPLEFDNSKNCLFNSINGGPVSNNYNVVQHGSPYIEVQDLYFLGLGTSITDTTILLVFHRENFVDDNALLNSIGFQLCNYINLKMGITGYIPSINDTAPFESQRALPFAAIDAGNYSDIPNLFLNKNQGCVYETSYGGFIYYLVAIER